MYLENPNIESVICNAKKLGNSTKDKILLLVGESCKIDLEKLVRSLNKENILFVGGVFPKVIYRDQTSDTGLIIKNINFDAIPIYFRNEIEFSEQFSDFQDDKFSAAFTLTDGLSDSVSKQLTTLFTHLGSNVRFFGGGVGRMKEKGEGILFNNDGVYPNGTLVVLLKDPICINAGHSWKKYLGPLIVTKSQNNLVMEINWQNAFEVYKQYLTEAIHTEVTPENFSQLSTHYPFGIYKEDRGHIVRDPIEVTPEGYLKCVGNIAENSLVDILNVDQKSLKNLPGEIFANCRVESNIKEAISIVFSCISREIHLQENFSEELANLNQKLRGIFPESNLEGALSIGEIYLNGFGYLEFLNKSVVLGYSY